MGILAGLDSHATAFNDAGADVFEFKDFYATACPHCKHLQPAWEAAQGMYTGPAKWQGVECADAQWNPVEANADACKDVMGFPTLKLFKNGNEIAEYQGNRTAEDLVKFVNDNTGAPEAQTQSMGPLGLLFAAVASNFAAGSDEERAEEKKANFL